MLQHTLIVGTTGSGKSYTEHLIIDDLLKNKKAQVILIDPKRMELVDYEDDPLTSVYADLSTNIGDAVVRAYDTMMIRFGHMKRNKQKEWPYLPLYVFVDEMGALMNDKKRRRQYGEMLGDIAMMGRAARVFLVLCTQVPTRENLPNSIRDNMTNKVCLRLDDSSRARFVLGTGANEWYTDLPRIGKAYVRTPDMIDRPELIDVSDICKVLDV